MIRKILVLRGGALGDFMITLPALSLLRERWPEAQVELAGNAVAAELGVRGGLLDRVHSQHERRWAALYGESPLPAEFAAWLGAFDLVVNYWPDPDGTLQQKFPVKEGQLFVWAAALPTLVPAAAHYYAAIEEIGVKGHGRAITPSAAGNGFCSRLSLPNSSTPPRGAAPCIAVHPGSGSPRKNWPAERWLELIISIQAPILLILGEAELEKWSDWTSTRLNPNGAIQRIGANTLQLAANLPLPELAGRLQGCVLFLGHDSGVSHLAAALGVPSLLLFGPTDPAMWAPPGEHVKVIRRDADLASISVEEVSRVVAAHLSP